MKKILLVFFIFSFSQVAYSEIQFDCFSQTSDYKELSVDLEKKIVYFDDGSMYIITSVTDRHVFAEHRVLKTKRLVFNRYTLILGWHDIFANHHNFKCKLLKKQF